MSRIDAAIYKLARRIADDPTRANVADASKLARAVLLLLERAR
jgi:hypothetical protein